MTQHITQKAIREVGGIIHRDESIFFTNIEKLNAAIQHHIDSRKAELPALPEPAMITHGAIDPTPRHWYTADQLQAYGQQCADWARERSATIARTTRHHESTDFANGLNRAALNIEHAIRSMK